MWKREPRHRLPLGSGMLFGSVLLGGVLGCFASGLKASPGFDVLHDPAPRAAHTLRGVEIKDAAQYEELRHWGETWFRTETFGAERTTTDVAGLFQAELEIPCDESPASPGCRKKTSALPYLIRALDALDGVPGNLYSGNGGPLGLGFTNDLVLEFPPGTTVAGLPVPEHLHTGLDVDAGSAWPIGIEPVKAPPEDDSLPYLIEPAALGAGPAEPGKYRIGITCALCHYSLDIDKDGVPDVRSSRYGEVTPGALWGPEATWGIGNQDLHFGWLFALVNNPLLGFTVLSGPIGTPRAEDAVSWVRWVKENYQQKPEEVRREVIRGMLVQPRGLADDTPNALHDPNQLPVLFTYRNWPYNFDGSFADASDRNNGVWTGAVDFTGLVALARDRAGSKQGLLYWEPPSIYRNLSAREYAQLIVHASPAVQHDPAQEERLIADILGTSDGIPGLLAPENVVLMKNTLGAFPDEFLDCKNAVKNPHCTRTPADYGGDAKHRGSMMVLLGTRVITSARARKEAHLESWLARYPGLNADDFESDSVSLLLDSLVPPTNHSPLLHGQSALVARGYELFQAEGCADCHRGPYLTDNSMHRLFDRRAAEIGIAAPSTAAFRALGRGGGPALGTAPFRSLSNRALQLYVAGPYDPETGRATATGNVLNGLFGTRPVGYKSITLRHLWGSAPYLHDGGVAVALKPGSSPAETDLIRLLQRPVSEQLQGMGPILAYREEHQASGPWANAALSLQALLLEAVRKEVMANNQALLMVVPKAAGEQSSLPDRVSIASLGVEGQGHAFWIDDVPGGPRVSALVAFLLSLDDNPGELP